MKYDINGTKNIIINENFFDGSDEINSFYRVPQENIINNNSYEDLDDQELLYEIGTTITVDLKNIPVSNIFNYILDCLKISYLNEQRIHTIPFDDAFSIDRLNNTLRGHNKYIQIVLYNLDNLNEEEKILIKQLYEFNSNNFNVVIFTMNDFIIKEETKKTKTLTIR